MSVAVQSSTVVHSVHSSKARVDDETLSSGAVIHWSERNGKRAPVTCGVPGHPRRIVSVPGGKARLAWDGKCRLCPKPKLVRLADDEVLPSGSIYHWSERKGSRVPVTCGVCRVKRTVKARALVDRQKPRAGYHLKCVIGQLPPQAKTKLQDETLPSGAVVRWSERRKAGEREEVPVVCICGAVNIYNRLSITPRTSGCCTRHSAAELVALACAKSSAVVGAELAEAPRGQNGSGKGGRPPKFSDAEAFAAIDELGSRLSVAQLARRLRCSRPTVDNWVERKGYGSLEELVEAECRPPAEGARN